MSKVFEAKEVAEHASADSAWIIVEGGVYDMTDFLDEHPGGKKILLTSCGKDSTDKFWKFHSKKVLTKTAKPFLIGQIKEGSKL
ncbi:putative cytochrome b5 [Pseudohyphozyma bogoriensis]|nr:putative cytochrome b5 [Pseudohyphozyma bogoriensis]